MTLIKKIGSAALLVAFLAVPALAENQKKDIDTDSFSHESPKAPQGQPTPAPVPNPNAKASKEIKIWLKDEPTKIPMRELNGEHKGWQPTIPPKN